MEAHLVLVWLTFRSRNTNMRSCRFDYYPRVSDDSRRLFCKTSLTNAPRMIGEVRLSMVPLVRRAAWVHWGASPKRYFLTFFGNNRGPCVITSNAQSR